MSVAIIGAGRLGTALALALTESGFDITCLVAAHRTRAVHATGLIKARVAESSRQLPPLALTAAEFDRIPPSDVYLFATPDDKLPEADQALAIALREYGSAHSTSCVALHTSGALAGKALVALRELGCATGSLHPLVAVTKDAIEGARSLQKAFYCIEGARAALHAARRIVRALKGRSFTIPASKKALYHAAAVLTSGHAVALFDFSCEMLMRCGMKEPAAREVLLPLLASTLRNLQTHAPAAALTGTIARSDLATLRLHLEALRTARLPLAAEVYRLLGRRAVELARANGGDSRVLKRIEEELRSKP